MNKALILPIVSLVALFVKQFTGYDFNDELVNQVTDALLSVVILSGIFMHPKKKK